jgi:tetratricopeptide (TPR) repeat protein
VGLTEALAAVAAAPTGSDPWARAMDDLAEVHADAGHLDQAIQVRADAIAGLAPGLDPEIGRELASSLGIDFMSRYRQAGDEQDLRAAVELGEAALAAAPPPDRLRMAANLAGRWVSLSLRPGHAEALGRALTLIDSALAEASPQDRTYAVAVSTLAGVHMRLWHRDLDRPRLEAGVRRIRDALEVIADPGLEAVNIAGLIAEIAGERYDIDLLGQAEALLRRVLHRTETLPEASHQLAIILLDRYEWTGDRGALADALEAADAAVTASPESGTLRAGALSARSMIRATIGRADGEAAPPIEAVTDARAALAAHNPNEPDAPDSTEYLVNLGLLLAERYDLLGDSGDLDESVELTDRALSLGPPADMYPSIAGNQANNLLARYERDHDPDDLDRGIALAEQAVTASSPDSAQFAARNDTAGRLYAARAQHGNADDIAAAERYAATAVATTDPRSPDQAIYLNNWAMWVTDRWERTSDEQALHEAIELLERARAAVDADTSLGATIAFNLAVRLQERYELSLTDGRGSLAGLQRTADLLDEVLAAGYPQLDVVAAKRLGDIAWRTSLWPEAEHAFRLSLAAAGELTGLRPQRRDKERARSGVQGIGAAAALSAARAGNPRAAAVHLEQASATLIAEAIGVATTGVTFDGIVDGAELMRRHVLFLGCTPGGGIAALVGRDHTVRTVELPLLTEDAVAEQTASFRQAISGPDVEAARRSADALAAWTLDAVLGPVLTILDDVARLAVLPLGRLSWLPVTTAGPGLLAPYEPVLLIRATPRRESAASESDRGESAAAPGDGQAPRRVVVWADIGPPEHRIPAVVREARRVARLHSGAQVRIVERAARVTATRAGPEPTPSNPMQDADDVLATLLDVDIAHVACHCEVDPERPQDTVLHVDPPIRIGARTVAGRAGRAHVVLSACDAAQTATALPDEALSAATAFLLAGAGTVTAPLWPVTDATTPAFMAEFHAALATGQSAARALTDVQRRWAAGRPMMTYGPWTVTVWPEADDAQAS